MSSVDIHTHCGYQMQLPEGFFFLFTLTISYNIMFLFPKAIAIVMAPMDSKNSVGIFQITDPPG